MRNRHVDDVSSPKRRPARQRTAYPQEVNGAIYGYPPGIYRRGPNGILYGPYPLSSSRSARMP